MLSFKDFSNELLIIESIRYQDRTLFRNIVNGKYEPTKNELLKWEKNQKLINEDTERKYLDNDQEVELIKKYQADPTSKEGIDAMNKLIENKMPYIYSKVGKILVLHPEWRKDKDDMVQEASITLMKCIEKFDPSTKNIFNAYIKPSITGCLLNFHNTNRKKSVDNQKGDVGFMASIDDKISGSRGEWADKDSTVGDTIPDESESSNIFGSMEDDEKRAALADWISQLPSAEKRAITMRFYPPVGQDPKTFDQIGKAIGMSTMGAKKLVDRVVANMTRMAEEQGLKD